MRITEAIEQSKRKLAWRPYYADLSMMEDESVAKAIWAEGEGGPFTLHWFDTGFCICDLAPHDLDKVKGMDDWRPVDPISIDLSATCSVEIEYADSLGGSVSKPSVSESMAVALEKVRAKLPSLYEAPGMRLFGIPYHSDAEVGEWKGLDRSDYKVSSRSMRMPITSYPTLTAVTPLTPHILKSAEEKIKAGLGVAPFKDVYGTGVSPTVVAAETMYDTCKAIIYEWESSALRSMGKHKAKPSKSKMKIPFYRFRR